MLTLFQLCEWVFQRKNYENRLAFGDVTDKSVGTRFFTTCSSVSIICNYRPHKCDGKCNGRRPSVPLSVCFKSIFRTDRLLTLNFCVWVCHDHSLQEIKYQGRQGCGSGYCGRSGLNWGSIFSSLHCVYLELEITLAMNCIYKITCILSMVFMFFCTNCT